MPYIIMYIESDRMPGHDCVPANSVLAGFYGDGFEIAMEGGGPRDGLLVFHKADGWLT